MSRFFKVAGKADWIYQMQKFNCYKGNEVEQTKGFIHLSTKEVIRSVINKKYLRAEEPLLLVCVDSTKLDHWKVKFVRNENGDVFPRYYNGVLYERQVVWKKELIKKNGMIVFPHLN